MAAQLKLIQEGKENSMDREKALVRQGLGDEAGQP